MYTYIDASFGTHADRKSHTGVYATLGTGGFYTKSTCQKINTTSSCEAEIVALAKGLQQSIWSRSFLIAQGFPPHPITVYQDNQAAIKLIERGRPAAEQTRHIDRGFFWVSDLVARGVINVVFCPTLSMVADFFTKPLTGSLFSSMRGYILGRLHQSPLSPTVPRGSTLHVEDHPAPVCAQRDQYHMSPIHRVNDTV